jgi:hypothetical protein
VAGHRHRGDHRGRLAPRAGCCPDRWRCPCCSPSPARAPHYGTGGNANRLKETAPEWHDKRPDADKLARAVLDAITESGTIRDDAQVVSLQVRKRYGQPGVRITLGEEL